MWSQFFRRVIAALRNRLWPGQRPGDPFVGVREPRRRTPGGRTSAVAVAEPEPRSTVTAVGRR